MGHHGGWPECHSPEAPTCRRQKGISSRSLSGLGRALGPTMASSPWVAVHLGLLPDTRHSLSRAKPSPGRIANLSLLPPPPPLSSYPHWPDDK